MAVIGLVTDVLGAVLYCATGALLQVSNMVWDMPPLPVGTEASGSEVSALWYGHPQAVPTYCNAVGVLSKQAVCQERYM